MMSIFRLIGLCLICIGCSKDNTPMHYQLAEKLMNQFVKQVEKQYQVRCYGSGGGFMDRVNRISLSFDAVGPMSQVELRKLIINLTEDFLDKINNDTEIRPYLANYPFTLYNLDFSVILVEKNNRNKSIKNLGNSQDLLCFALLSRGNVNYYIENDEMKNFQKVYEEPYEDALRLVQEIK